MRIGKGWFFASAFFVAASAHAMTADELVTKNVAARGGMESLAAIKSLRLSGKMLLGGFGVEIDAVQIYKRPGAYRFEGVLQGMTMVQSYDGKEAWRIFPFQGRKDPERTSADDAKELAEQADFDGGWVNASAKGNKLDYLGSEDVDGTDAHKLKVTLDNGDVEYVFFDPDAPLSSSAHLKQRTVRGVEQRRKRTTAITRRSTARSWRFPHRAATPATRSGPSSPWTRPMRTHPSTTPRLHFPPAIRDRGQIMLGRIHECHLLRPAAECRDGGRVRIAPVKSTPERFPAWARNIGSSAMSGRIACPRRAPRGRRYRDDVRRRRFRRRCGSRSTAARRSTRCSDKQPVQSIG